VEYYGAPTVKKNIVIGKEANTWTYLLA